MVALLEDAVDAALEGGADLRADTEAYAEGYVVEATGAGGLVVDFGP
jgi:hypothetical protein